MGELGLRHHTVGEYYGVNLAIWPMCCLVVERWPRQLSVGLSYGASSLCISQITATAPLIRRRNICLIWSVANTWGAGHAKANREPAPT